MSTQLRPPTPASESPLDRLGELLSGPPSELEANAPFVVDALAELSPAALESVAPRILAVLDVPSFGVQSTKGVRLRTALVATIEKVGLPFVTQLRPEDASLTRRSATSLGRVTTRRRLFAWVAAALVPALVGGGIWYQRRVSRLELIKRSSPEEYLRQVHRSGPLVPIVTAERAVPDAAELITDAIRHASAPGAVAAASLDCLALGWDHRRSCLTATADALEHGVKTEWAIGVARELREALARPPMSPGEERAGLATIIAELDGFATLPSRPLPLSDEQRTLREAVTHGDVSEVRSSGFREPAVPDADAPLDWALTVFTAHQLIGPLLESEALSENAEAIEKTRRVIAHLLAQERRYRCLRAPDPSPTRPLGCP